MEQDPNTGSDDIQINAHQNIEQSWIVLDSGWGSRPPTASPTRPVRADDDDEEESKFPRHIGMDRDVREALELAERSLELGGSSDDFSRRSNRENSDDDNSTVRSSPANRSHFTNVFADEMLEDKYNGRGPPVISSNRRNAGGILISTDSEHVAFQNIKLVSSMNRPDTPIPGLNYSLSSSAFKDFGSEVPNSTVALISAPNISASSPALPETNEEQNSKIEDEEEEEEGSFLHSFFGLPGNSSLIPLVFSHMVTLLVGFYIGSRRSSSSAHSTSHSSPTTVSPTTPPATSTAS